LKPQQGGKKRCSKIKKPEVAKEHSPKNSVDTGRPKCPGERPPKENLRETRRKGKNPVQHCGRWYTRSVVEKKRIGTTRGTTAGERAARPGSTSKKKPVRKKEGPSRGTTRPHGGRPRQKKSEMRQKGRTKKGKSHRKEKKIEEPGICRKGGRVELLGVLDRRSCLEKKGRRSRKKRPQRETPLVKPKSLNITRTSLNEEGKKAGGGGAGLARKIFFEERPRGGKTV